MNNAACDYVESKNTHYELPTMDFYGVVSCLDDKHNYDSICYDYRNLYNT